MINSLQSLSRVQLFALKSLSDSCNICVLSLFGSVVIFLIKVAILTFLGMTSEF